MIFAKIFKGITNFFCSISFNRWLLVIFLLKVVLLFLFSSDYVFKLFIPFVEHFLSNFDNPWQYFYTHASWVEFPYNPFMLYILSFFYLPVWAFNITCSCLQSFALKIPTFISDILITFLLIKSFPNKLKEILIFYCACPIIIYASYMHSQLDLVPTAILFLSFYFLKKQEMFFSALSFGLALSIKLHVGAAFPLMLVYVLKNYNLRKAINFFITSFLTYLFFVLPFLFSDGFYHLVLANQKQMMMFNVYAYVGNLKVYLPIFALLGVYGRFLAYSKTNSELLDAFSGIVFSLFVLLIIPAPGWYIWMWPFLSLFFIKIYYQSSKIMFFYIGLCLIYLIFFIFFYMPEHADLIFLKTPIDFKIYSDRLRSLVFTVLEVFLVFVIYALYKFGVRSNAIYKKNNALVIGIGGDSGAGKSTLMTDIKCLLGSNVTELEGDGDHKWERGDVHWQRFTHLDPKANYIHRQADQLRSLKVGKSIVRMEYDHSTGKFNKSEPIVPHDFIVLSGLHPFYLPKMRKIIDFKIYLDPDPQLRVHWKILRDLDKRGYTKEKVLEQLNKRTLDVTKYIAPQKAFADMVISYFVQDDFDVGDVNAQINVKLKVILDSSIKLENFVHEFASNEICVEWDYSDDLKNQYLIFSQEISQEILAKIAKALIPSVQEIIRDDIIWQNGYRGVMQLLILTVLSEKMKEPDEKVYV